MTDAAMSEPHPGPTPTGPGAAPPPPVRPLSERGIDFLLWGVLAVLLAVSFWPAELYKFPQLFSNSGRMGDFLSGFLRPEFGISEELGPTPFPLRSRRDAAHLPGKPAPLSP